MAMRYFLTMAPAVICVPRSWRRCLGVKWAFRWRLPQMPCFSLPLAVRFMRLATLLFVLFFLAMGVTHSGSRRPGDAFRSHRLVPGRPAEIGLVIYEWKATRPSKFAGKLRLPAARGARLR